MYELTQLFLRNISIKLVGNLNTGKIGFRKTQITEISSGIEEILRRRYSWF